MQLSQQMDLLVQENHSLMQAKMSLGLEVATYRYSHSIPCEQRSGSNPNMHQCCRHRNATHKEKLLTAAWASEAEASHRQTLAAALGAERSSLIGHYRGPQ